MQPKVNVLCMSTVSLWIVVFDVSSSLFLVQSGLTPLLRALSGGSVECVKLLLNRGAQANQEDKVHLHESVG